MITIEGVIQKYNDNFYLGWIPKFKGVVIQAESFEDAKRELLTSIKVKIAFDYKLDISKVKADELTNANTLLTEGKKVRNEYKFELAL